MIRELIAKRGEDSIAELGAKMLAQVQDRLNVCDILEVRKVTIILMDHEFAAVAFALAKMGNVACASVQEVDGKPIVKLEEYEAVKHIHAVEQIGILYYNDHMIVSEGRAQAEMLDQAETNVHAKMGFN